MSIEWTETKYGSARASLGFGLHLSVHWESIEQVGAAEPRWNVHVFGQRLEKRSPDLEDGKRRAESVARMCLTKALAKLNPQPEKEKST